MKKIVLLLILFLFFGLPASADFNSALNKINSVLNTVERTEYTIKRTNDRIQKYTPNEETNNQKKQKDQQYNNQQYNSYGKLYNNDDETIEYTQQQYIPEGRKYSQDRIYKGQASTLGQLPAGTMVMDPKSVWNFRNGVNYSGEIVLSHPVLWRKLEDNHYVEGSTLLLSEVRIAQYPFCHSNKGLRAWDESDARRFLRTTFYNHLSEGFKTAIVNVNIPFADMNGNPKTVNDNFFLLSIVEWGLSDRTNNGSVIKYNNIPDMYKTIIMGFNNNNYISFYRDTGSTTRTINRPVAKSAGYDSDVFNVLNGTLATYWAGGNWNIRPAVNLKSSTKVSGPYEVKSKYEKIIYYALEF